VITVRVTIVIPAFQAAAFLGSALESILAQTHRDTEVLVIDDGSSDGTSAVAEAYALRDDRIRLRRQTNRGVSSARNRGIAEATGEFLAFLDADDEWFPNKLERQLREFETPRCAVAVGCLMEYVSTRGAVLGISGESAQGRQEDIIGARFMPFALSSLLTRTELVRELGAFDERLGETIPGQVEDLDLVSRLACHGAVITVPEVLGRYRVHAGGASARYYFSQRLGARYLEARVKAREHGRELDWNAFRSEHPPTLRQKLSDLVGYCYRTAGLRLADGRIASGSFFLASAGVLGPRYTLKRLVRQRRRRRRGSSRWG
jgi:glycosyltransferase involved in cell wall biosynthesis